ncbi:MAG TPA: SHOCT domain-containing protein [Actinomycetota bacterium]
MMWGNGWGDWVAGVLMMVLFWGGLVALVFLVLRSWDTNRRRDGGNPDRPHARTILEERFARGEISEEEFEQRRRVLEHATH